jgi:hypothetical protein
MVTTMATDDLSSEAEEEVSSEVEMNLRWPHSDDRDTSDSENNDNDISDDGDTSNDDDTSDDTFD